MSHLPFTLLAYFLNGVAVTVDKFLLTKHIPDPLIYIFYYSVVSLIALVFLPFTNIPSVEVLVLASFSTLLWTTGAYFMFKALQIGLLSRVIPVIGTLIPLFLLVDANLTGKVNLEQTWAVVFLIFGLVFLTISDWRGKISINELILEIASALFFAVSYLVLRQAYLNEHFLTVFVWSRPILIVIGVMILSVPKLRQIVFTAHGPKLNPFSKIGALFLAGQTSGGISELLLTFSVSLATPALVNSLQGTQYIFLFIFSLILSRKFPQIYQESAKLVILISKLIGIGFIAMGLFMLTQDQTSKKVTLGATFSARYADSLGLNPKDTYLQALDNLQIKHLRLPVYWDEVEKEEAKFDFSQVEDYLNEAEKRDVEVILVLGYKQPRWPECFPPAWVKNLPKEKLQQQILRLLEAEVNNFKNFPAIKVWQVENEPFLNFGECSGENPLDYDFVKKEVELVKSLDSRPILLTDSGELTNWKDSISLSDIHGISLYRTVWNPHLGHIDYPFPPVYYKLKAGFLRKLAGTGSNQTIVAELQAEPWVPAQKTMNDWEIEEQVKNYPARKIADNLEFSKLTGFKSHFLWGVEWWFFMAKNSHPEYLESAKQLFK